MIQPSKPLTVSRVERNTQKLESLYNQGYEDAIQIYEKLLKWMKE